MITYESLLECGSRPLEALAFLYSPRPLPVIAALLAVRPADPDWGIVRSYLRALGTCRLQPDHPDLALRGRALEVAYSRREPIVNHGLLETLGLEVLWVDGKLSFVRKDQAGLVGRSSRSAS